jgi:hypothetical protein
VIIGLHKILILVAVVTVISHNCLPHYHHVSEESLIHHDELTSDDADLDHHDHEVPDKDHHNVFSHVQLDDDFLPSQSGKKTGDLPVLFLFASSLNIQLLEIKEYSKPDYGYYREFPPPKVYSSNLFSRPPPSC